MRIERRGDLRDRKRHRGLEFYFLLYYSDLEVHRGTREEIGW